MRGPLRVAYRSGAAVAPARPPHDRDIAHLAVLSARLDDASPPLSAQPRGSLSLRSVLHFTVSDRLDELDELDDRTSKILITARDRAQRSVDGLWRNAATPPRLLHADLTPANVLRDDEHGLSVIDLQDLSCVHGPISISICSLNSWPHDGWRW